jgi:hypothetical protein
LATATTTKMDLSDDHSEIQFMQLSEIQFSSIADFMQDMAAFGRSEKKRKTPAGSDSFFL